MLKKIALTTLFVLVSVVSFSASSVNAKPAADLSTVGAPIMKGLACGGAGRC